MPDSHAARMRPGEQELELKDLLPPSVRNNHDRGSSRFSRGWSGLVDAVHQLPIRRAIFMHELGSRTIDGGQPSQVCLGRSSTLMALDSSDDACLIAGGGGSYRCVRRSPKSQQRLDVAMGILLSLICLWDILSDIWTAKILWKCGSTAAFAVCVALLALPCLISMALLAFYGQPCCFGYTITDIVASILLLFPLDVAALATVHFLPWAAQISSASHKFRYKTTKFEVFLRAHGTSRILVRTLLETLPMLILQVVVLVLSRVGGSVGSRLIQLSTSDTGIVGMSLAASITATVSAIIVLSMVASAAKTSNIKATWTVLRYQGCAPVSQVWMDKARSGRKQTVIDLSLNGFSSLHRLQKICLLWSVIHGKAVVCVSNSTGAAEYVGNSKMQDCHLRMAAAAPQAYAAGASAAEEGVGFGSAAERGNRADVAPGMVTWLIVGNKEAVTELNALLPISGLNLTKGAALHERCGGDTSADVFLSLVSFQTDGLRPQNWSKHISQLIDLLLEFDAIQLLVKDMPLLGLGMEVLCTSISSPQLTHLSRLILEQMNLNNKTLKQLCAAMSTNCSVLHLGLSSNSLGSLGSGYIQTMLQDNSTLCELVLAYCSMDSDAAAQVLEGAVGSCSLLYLDLSQNRIRCGIALPASLLQATANARHAGIGESTASSLPSQGGIRGGVGPICSLRAARSSLRHLDLSFNWIQDDMATWILFAYESFPHLSHLHLNHNRTAPHIYPVSSQRSSPRNSPRLSMALPHDVPSASQPIPNSRGMNGRSGRLSGLSRQNTGASIASTGPRLSSYLVHTDAHSGKDRGLCILAHLHHYDPSGGLKAWLANMKVMDLRGIAFPSWFRDVQPQGIVVDAGLTYLGDRTTLELPERWKQRLSKPTLIIDCSEWDWLRLPQAQQIAVLYLIFRRWGARVVEYSHACVHVTNSRSSVGTGPQSCPVQSASTSAADMRLGRHRLSLNQDKVQRAGSTESFGMQSGLVYPMQPELGLQTSPSGSLLSPPGWSALLKNNRSQRTQVMSLSSVPSLDSSVDLSSPMVTVSEPVSHQGVTEPTVLEPVSRQGVGEPTLSESVNLQGAAEPTVSEPVSRQGVAGTTDIEKHNAGSGGGCGSGGGGEKVALLLETLTGGEVTMVLATEMQQLMSTMSRDVMFSGEEDALTLMLNSVRCSGDADSAVGALEDGVAKGSCKGPSTSRGLASGASNLDAARGVSEAGSSSVGTAKGSSVPGSISFRTSTTSSSFHSSAFNSPAQRESPLEDPEGVLTGNSAVASSASRMLPAQSQSGMATLPESSAIASGAVKVWKKCSCGTVSRSSGIVVSLAAGVANDSSGASVMPHDPMPTQHDPMTPQRDPTSPRLSRSQISDLSTSRCHIFDHRFQIPHLVAVNSVCVADGQSLQLDSSFIDKESSKLSNLWSPRPRPLDCDLPPLGQAACGTRILLLCQGLESPLEKVVSEGALFASICDGLIPAATDMEIMPHSELSGQALTAPAALAPTAPHGCTSFQLLDHISNTTQNCTPTLAHSSELCSPFKESPSKGTLGDVSQWGHTIPPSGASPSDEDPHAGLEATRVGINPPPLFVASSKSTTGMTAPESSKLIKGLSYVMARDKKDRDSADTGPEEVGELLSLSGGSAVHHFVRNTTTTDTVSEFEQQPSRMPSFINGEGISVVTENVCRVQELPNSAILIIGCLDNGSAKHFLPFNNWLLPIWSNLHHQTILHHPPIANRSNSNPEEGVNVRPRSGPEIGEAQQRAREIDAAQQCYAPLQRNMELDGSFGGFMAEHILVGHRSAEPSHGASWGGALNEATDGGIGSPLSYEQQGSPFPTASSQATRQFQVESLSDTSALCPLPYVGFNIQGLTGKEAQQLNALLPFLRHSSEQLAQSAFNST